ncbi:hypothetical protein F5B18DRAFT_635441 [Nemania serpens]|nr:hypothetical protein F5B18DRAFT_635441 [Nemania serpens]
MSSPSSHCFFRNTYIVIIHLQVLTLVLASIIMPPPRRRLDELRDDVWGKNKTTLRRLYLEDRKSLKDVKRIMESEHGFPITPLSTYESKLRDLGLRKKMKKTDWHPVYQHYVNSGNKHTAMLFNGIRIPWDRAWKEIRRSGAREINVGHSIGLPADVTMRTPSPILVASSITAFSRMPVPWNLGDVSLVDLSPAAVVHRSKLFDIPSNRLRIEMLERDQLSNASHPLRDSTNSSIQYTILNWVVTTPQQSSHLTDIHSDIDRLSSALYRLTNDGFVMPRPGEPLPGPLNVLLSLIPRHVLLKLFESDSPIIRAAFDNLMQSSSISDQGDLFSGLVQIVWHFRAKWTFTDKYLSWAGRRGCFDSCRLLLQTRDYSEGEPSRSFCSMNYVEAFLHSVSNGHIECAKILFQHIMPIDTAQIWVESSPAHTIFAQFISAVASDSYHHYPFRLENPAVLHILDWLLETGADLHLPLPSRFSFFANRICYTPSKWRFTILDFVFYINPSLYSRLAAARSIKSGTEATRVGIRDSAKEGLESLRIYLHSRTSHTPAQQDEFVDNLLIEDLLMSHSYFHTHLDFDVVHALLHYNLDFLAFRLKLTMSAILNCVVGAAGRQGMLSRSIYTVSTGKVLTASFLPQHMHPAISEIIKTLIKKGAEIGAETMHAAVESEGTALLQLLSSYGADFKSQGALALKTAAKLGNYDAVNSLLEMGVDINATLWNDRMEREITVTAFANVCSDDDGIRMFGCCPPVRIITMQTKCRLISCEMFQHLIARGAKLRTTPASYSIQRLLYFIIRNGIENDDWPGTFDRVRTLLHLEPLGDSLSCTDPGPLEACFQDSMGEVSLPQRLQLFYFLLDRNISIRHSGILAKLIQIDSPRNEIYRVLDSGADVNVYCGKGLEKEEQFTPLQAAAGADSLDWVRLLVERGADVNQPAKGKEGRTALQAACDRYLPGEEEYSDNIKLIKLLIEQGAHVNAPPSPESGVTAFQAAATQGNFEVALLLLDYGADINAPPSEIGGLCALDGAALTGKLDMVHFLLDLGAFSFDRGESGYRGAIRMAEGNEKQTMADMIRQYALKKGESGEELHLHYKEWKGSDSKERRHLNNADKITEVGFDEFGYWEDMLLI